MPDIDLSTFPSSKVEALAYLYVQKKEYSNPTPETLAEDYMNAYKRIRNFFAEHRDASYWR